MMHEVVAPGGKKGAGTSFHVIIIANIANFFIIRCSIKKNNEQGADRLHCAIINSGGSWLRE